MENVVPIDYFMQYGFSCVVTVYLLYERTRFNQKISDTLKVICVTLQTMNNIKPKE
jgi:hypothetical protein